MKTIKLTFVFTLVLFAFNMQTKAQISHPYRWYPVEIKSSAPVYVDSKDAILLNTMAPNQFSTKDSSIYFGPSVAFDVFEKERSSGAYTLGVIPGVGYGVKYNPFLWSNSYLVGLDLFAQAGLTGSQTDPTAAKYFVVDIVPVITVINWVHIGWGPRFKIGLNGTSNANTSLFTIGISKSL